MSYTCPICSQQFDTQNGLQIHCLLRSDSQHRIQVERITPPTKPLIDPEEDVCVLTTKQQGEEDVKASIRKI